MAAAATARRGVMVVLASLNPGAGSAPLQCTLVKSVNVSFNKLREICTFWCYGRNINGLGYNSKIANNNWHNSTKIISVYKKGNRDIRDETRHSVFAKKEGVAFKQTT